MWKRNAVAVALASAGLVLAAPAANAAPATRSQYDKIQTSLVNSTGTTRYEVAQILGRDGVRVNVQQDAIGTVLRRQYRAQDGHLFQVVYLRATGDTKFRALMKLDCAGSTCAS